MQLEKKRRQAEAAAKAKSAADEAQRVMDLFRSKEGSMAPSEAAAEGGGLEGTPAGSHPPASSKKPEGSSPEGAFPTGKLAPSHLCSHELSAQLPEYNKKVTRLPSGLS